MKTRLLLLFVIPILWLTSAYGMKMVRLYQIDVPVTGQSDEEKVTAIKQGFIEMLVRLSGDKQIDSHPNLQGSLKKPEAYVEELRYQSLLRSPTPYALSIRFNKDDLNRLLKRAGISIWGEKRPVVLVWLTVTDQSHANEIIGNDTPDTVFNLIKKEGRQFGLPLIFPMMDMIDLTLISPMDINSASLIKLKAASRRYAADAILIGNIQQNNDAYASAWQLAVGEKTWDFTLNDNNYPQLFGDLLTKVSQTLSKQKFVKRADAQSSSFFQSFNVQDFYIVKLLNQWTS
ncbi:MAG: DUF2066 domain-containing protein [Gammaproteobacteria bacterium]|nr:DUF2066 domain-containing protein [Gammaproteobacteria bacterium]